MPCGAGGLRASRSRRTIVGHQAQENLRAHPDANATKAYEEKVDRGKIPHAETNRYGGEVAYAQTNDHAGEIRIAEEEKSLGEPDSFRDAISESLRLHEKEEVFAEPVSEIFSGSFDQEKETQVVADPQPIAWGISGSFGDAERDT